ncbi:hypothetical protein FG05_06380 [Fusarium graminearum]|nr:hypothetical protein FG05_06380 [Fusarium graminearum]
MKLIPDILVAESIESVQAFLLFGLHTLPADPAGLSYTYFGIAIKLATQLNLHLKTTSISCARDLEVRKRVWWTAFLHGRPASISRFDVNADLSVYMEELQPKERINTFHNTMAMLRINIFMEDARDRICFIVENFNPGVSCTEGVEWLKLRQAILMIRIIPSEMPMRKGSKYFKMCQQSFFP